MLINITLATLLIIIKPKSNKLKLQDVHSKNQTSVLSMND